MFDINKEDKRRMKSFNLNKKSDFIIYLQELIVRLDKCIVKYKRYLGKLDLYIKDVSEKDNEDKKLVKSEDYGEFVDLLSNIQGYVLNLIGDHQSISLSYYKFRDIISKRIKKGTLDFELPKIDEEIESILKEFNKLRNWHNHVPESLLMSEIHLIEKGHLVGHYQNPIIVNYHNYVTLDYIQDLYDTSYNFYQMTRKIHQSMKKDYASLIGESVSIKRNYIDNPKSIDYLEVTKLSAKVQNIKAGEN